jgi:hypothetical protein
MEKHCTICTAVVGALLPAHFSFKSLPRGRFFVRPPSQVRQLLPFVCHSKPECLVKGPGSYRGPKSPKQECYSFLPGPVEQIIDSDSERLDVTTAISESVDDASAGDSHRKACIVQRQVIVLQFRRPVLRECIFDTGAH